VSVTVIEPAGTHLKLPAWMLAPDAGRFSVADEATIAPRALLELSDLLAGTSTGS